MVEVKQRQQACCPKCGKLDVGYLKKKHLMHCRHCGAEWDKSITPHKEIRVHNNLPKGLREIAERKAAKKQQG
jgi:ribosomal protein L37AE/L43A